MQKDKRKPVVIYQAPLWLRMLHVSMSVACIVGFVGVTSVFLLEIGLVPITIVMGLATIFFSYILFWKLIETGFSRLVLYQDGFAVQCIGVTVFTTWENTKQFGFTFPLSPRTRADSTGILLHKPVMPAPQSLVARILFGKRTRFIVSGYCVHIPRSFFSRRLDAQAVLKTDFGQHVYEYAPHLFDDVAVTTEKNKV
ncbi:MAG: hypothetical protein AAFR81_13980 [Chloroflexota bacterium]